MSNVNLPKSAARALLSGAIALGGLGLVPAIAHADAWGNHQWCPGQAVPKSDVAITWDMNACHDYHYEGAWTVVEGIRPNPCPPIAFLCP